MTTGLKDLYFAPITMTDGKETYGTPVKMAEAITADLSVNVAEATLYADDTLNQSVKEFTNGTIKLGVADLDAEVLASILGQSTDEAGVTWASGNDVAPYVAIGFRAAKPNGIYRYIWLQKVQFAIPSESFETKGESISFKTPEIEGIFMKSIATEMWKADYTGLPTTPVAQSWFTEVMHTATTESA